MGDPQRRVRGLEDQLQREGAWLGGLLDRKRRLRRRVEELRGERRLLLARAGQRARELAQTQREIEAAQRPMGTLPRDRGSPGAPGGDAAGRVREQQRRLRRFMETKERARPHPEPRPDAWVPPDAWFPLAAPGDPPEEVGEGQEEPPEEDEAPPRGLSRLLLVTQQQRQLQRLQQQRDQLQGALAAPGGPGGVSGGDPEMTQLEGETRDLQDRAQKGRSLLRLLGEGVSQLLAQLDEDADPDPDLDLDPGHDLDLDPDPLLAQLRHLEAAVTRLMVRGGGTPQVPAGDDEAAAAPNPPPLRPPSPREEPPGGSQDRLLSRGELRDRVLREVLSREGCSPPQ